VLAELLLLLLLLVVKIKDRREYQRTDNQIWEKGRGDEKKDRGHFFEVVWIGGSS
jgi:hypothetical protein